MGSTAEVVICGAGIAGISTAYHLAVQHNVQDILLVDERPPLSLTSDKSTECYRNWWPGPGPGMVNLTNRSIDIMEAFARQSGDRFHLNRRGYLYVTGDPACVPDLQRSAQEISALGAGPLRVHTGRAGEPAYTPAPTRGFKDQPGGADLILDTTLIHTYFPYLCEQTAAVLYARRCGWLSAQQLGMWMLEQARARGVRLLHGRVEGVSVRGSQVQSVRVSTTEGERVVSTERWVNAAGPFLKPVAKMVGVDLPVFNELHTKVAFNDHLSAVPRDVPMLIWADPQELGWSEAERAALAESEETQPLLSMLPSGAHLRPEGGEDSPVLLLLWEYQTVRMEPVWPPPFDPLVPEVLMRGLATMVPGLRAYFDRAPRPSVDGGYYTRTQENRPLIGPMPVDGAYVIGALSGFGIMVGCGAGELLAAHLTQSTLPEHASWFLMKRYQDPAYQALLENWEESGQL